MAFPTKRENGRLPKVDNTKAIENKKALLEQFKKQSMKANTRTKEVECNDETINQETNEENNRLTATINKLKKEIKSKDLKIQKLQLQSDEFNTYKTKNNDKINRYFEEIQELKDVITNKDNIITELNSTIDKLENIIESKNERLIELENRVGEGYVHPLEEENEKLRIQYKDIINRINQLKSLYNKVKFELSEEKDKEYKSKLEGMHKYVSTKDMGYEQSKEKWVTHIKRVEKKLENTKLTNERLQERINYLERKRGMAFKKSVKKGLRYLKTKKDDLRLRLIKFYKKVTNKNYKYVRHVYGKLHSEGRKFYLTDITTGDVLKVRYFFKKYENLDDKVCKGILTDKGDVIVTFVFMDESDYIADINKHATKIVKTKKEKDLKEKAKPQRLFNFEYKVLMISSMLRSDFVEYFASIGIEIDWFDSYRESAPRLKNILDKYDIVLYSTGHSRHFVGNIIRQQHDFKDNRTKYIYLTNQSKEVIEKELISSIKLIKRNQMMAEKEISSEMDE